MYVGAPPPIAYGYGPCPGCPKYHACDYTEHSDEADGRNGFHPYAQEDHAIHAWAREGIIRLGRVTTRTSHETRSCKALPRPSPAADGKALPRPSPAADGKALPRPSPAADVVATSTHEQGRNSEGEDRQRTTWDDRAPKREAAKQQRIEEEGARPRTTWEDRAPEREAAKQKRIEEREQQRAKEQPPSRSRAAGEQEVLTFPGGEGAPRPHRHR